MTVAQLHLVSPVVDMADVGGFRIDLAHWSHFVSEPASTHLWHSTDDTIVPINQSERFTAVYPAAVLHTFTDRFHFLTETFPELRAEIQK